MSILLIDDKGGCWDGGSRRVREAFNSPRSGEEFIDYTVKNLGFVAVTSYGSQSSQLRVNPAILSAKTFDALADWLTRHRQARVAVSWFERNVWRLEMMRPPEVLWRLDRMVKAARASRPSSIMTRLSDRADLPEAGAVYSLLQHMPKALGQDQQQALLSLIRRMLGERYIVVEGDPIRQKLVVKEYGSSIFKEQLPRPDKRIGVPVDEQPDLDYGRWAHDSYEEIIKAGRTRFEDVDAIVDWSEQGRMRLRYRRVVIPFKTHTGSSCVLAGSIKDDRIDLRIG